MTVPDVVFTASPTFQVGWAWANPREIASVSNERCIFSVIQDQKELKSSNLFEFSGLKPLK
jgi:hypothetical protein